MNYKPIIQKYINNVMTGRERVNLLAKLSVERHLKDLTHVYDNGMYFDEKAALKVLQFFTFLKHSKGSDFAGKPFVLSPWQAFVIWCQYGWKTAGGNRRFKYSYNDMARKNGKTTFAAGQALYLLLMDKEPGAEIYTVATKRDQAKICLNEARNIVRKSRDLKQFAQVFQHSVTYEAMGSFLQALSADANTLDGLNPHGVVLDEFHAHKDDLVFNVMKSAMGARANPMMILLTTAGFNRNVPCYAYRDVAKKVLSGVLQQDDLFASIHTLDDGDDYTDESLWIKSNPNLDVSINMDFLRREFKSAQNNPDQLYNFMTKNLNVWTDSEKSWIAHDVWNECGGEVENLDGAECFGGLDLASVRDTNALVLCFAKPDGSFSFKCFFWMPEMNVEERVKNKGINYDRWIRDGFVKQTPGNITDYDFIYTEIMTIMARYKVKAINYDRWNSSQLVIKCTESGVPMQSFGQGFVSMSAPSKEMYRLIASKKINHEANPVLSWHVSNVQMDRDAADNIKINKARSSEKVDGAVAMVMALAGWMNNPLAGDKDVNKIYKERGIRVL